MKDSIDKQIARQRNLLIIIVKQILNLNLEVDAKYTKNDIVNTFLFRQSDIKESLDSFFDNVNETQYMLKNNIQKKVEEYINKHQESEKNYTAIETHYLNTFSSFMNRVEMAGWNHEKFEEMLIEVNKDLEILHWFLLPLYKEHMFINRGMKPETDIKEYYNHFHTLEDLFYVIEGRYPNMMTLKGDINLDRSLNFKVYTRRWGHFDNYKVKRKLDGWYVEHLSIKGMSDKNGEGSLFENFEHDSIAFPKEGVKSAFETLWNMADEEDMTVEELQIKIQEIADWISAVEKTTGEKQPSWCGYY